MKSRKGRCLRAGRIGLCAVPVWRQEFSVLAQQCDSNRTLDAAFAGRLQAGQQFCKRGLTASIVS